MQEDATLVKQTLAGEEQAFHRLIVKYQSAIYRLILSYVKNHHDAQELAQEAFLEAYRDLDSLRKPEQFQFWLRQIARHQFDDWLRKKRIELVPIQESMVADVSQADELLILRETLAKVMQAIDELPETEKRLMKERYLDDASYPELQARHGLSSKALVMRLVRAREKVRESVKKALAGIGVLTWRKMLSGGVEAVKIGAKVKIITIGVAGMLVLGGAGILLWHSQNRQVESVIDASPTEQKASAGLPAKSISGEKNISNEQTGKLKDNQNEKAQISQAIAFLDSLSEDSQDKSTANGASEGKKDADSERKIFGMSVEEAHKKGAELRVELESWLNEAVALGDEILGRIDNASKISDPVAKEAEMELSRQATDRQVELIKKIAEWEMRYTFWAEDPESLKPGGWIYEMKMKIRPSGVIWSYPVE